MDCCLFKSETLFEKSRPILFKFVWVSKHVSNMSSMLLASDASSYMSGAAIPVDGAHLCNTL